MTGERGRGEETRRLVLRAAEEIFANVGYAGARMEDVAAKVGIRRASLFHYFRDKETLYAALLDDLFAGLLERYQVVLAGPGSAKERLLGCIDVWAERVEARSSLLRISLWEIAGASGVEPVPLSFRVRPIVKCLADAVEAAQREGSIRADIDPVSFVMSIAGTTAFLGRRTALLDASIAPAPEPGSLAVELRNWVTRILFTD